LYNNIILKKRVPVPSIDNQRKIVKILSVLDEKISINKKSKIRIISCWRYPGRSPVGKAIPIPEEIRSEIEEEIEKLKREPLKF